MPHGRLEPFSPLIRNSQTGHLHGHVFNADFSIFPEFRHFLVSARGKLGLIDVSGFGGRSRHNAFMSRRLYGHRRPVHYVTDSSTAGTASGLPSSPAVPPAD